MQPSLAHQAVRCLAVGIEVIFQEVGERLFLDFGHLQAGRLGRGRVVFLARERIAKAIDFPFAFGRFPRQYAVAIHLVGHVDDLLLRDDIAIVGGRDEVHHVRWRGIAGFLLGMVDSWGGIEFELWRDARFLVKCDSEIFGLRGLDVNGLPADAAVRNATDAPVVHTVVTHFEPFGHRCRLGCPDAAIVAVPDAQGLDGGGTLELVLDPIGLLQRVAGCEGGAKFFHRFVGWTRLYGEYADVLIPALVPFGFG